MTETDRKLDPAGVGFVVLCPLRNLGGFRTTVRTIHGSFPGQQIVGVVGADASDEEVAEFSREVPVVRAGTTVTSLVNAGAAQIKGDWICFLEAGTLARPAMFRQHRRFGPKDILFRVAGRRFHFADAPLEGLTVSREAFERIGPMADREDSLEIVKTFWALDAIEHGCRFVGLVGVRL